MPITSRARVALDFGKTNVVLKTGSSADAQHPDLFSSNCKTARGRIYSALFNLRLHEMLRSEGFRCSRFVFFPP